MSHVFFLENRLSFIIIDFLGKSILNNRFSKIIDFHNFSRIVIRFRTLEFDFKDPKKKLSFLFLGVSGFPFKSNKKTQFFLSLNTLEKCRRD
jgi:hypothetical protein